MNALHRLKPFFLGICLTLAACGGGGDDTTQAVTYSGAITRATVSSTNAKALSVDAYEGGQVGSSLGVLGVATESSPTATETARLQRLGTTLTGCVRRVVSAPSATGGATLTGASVQNDVTGAYGGSMHYTINADESTGAFSGTMTFSSFRDTASSGSMTGSVSFTGVLNLSTRNFSQFNVTISSLAVTESGQTYTAGGTLSLKVSGSTETMTMSLVLQESATGYSCWAKDYTYTLSSGTLTLSGTYYDSVHGYVTVTTLTPLTVATADAWPTAGQLLFTGASGTKARLTFTATSYTVEVDQYATGVYVVVP